MAQGQPHLERRSTGFYWRRRVPADRRSLFTEPFFCFPLRTNLHREAAVLARRLSAISEFCFTAEPDVSPEVMTQILVSYARLEIETHDRLRALTAPRSREAARAALAIEEASRQALRDAILLCDKAPAKPAIMMTAKRLGIALDDSDADMPVMADRMIRLMIEVSEEKSRRTQGHFREEQPYLGQALIAADAIQMPAMVPDRVDVPTMTPAEPTGRLAGTGAVLLASSENGVVTAEPLAAASAASARSGSGPTLLEVWDNWFADQSSGTTVSGAYVMKDEGLAARFSKNADTVLSTRKLVADIFGGVRVADLSQQDFQRFNDMLWKLPRNHGKSPRDRDLPSDRIIHRADDIERRQLVKAEREITMKQLAGDVST